MRECAGGGSLYTGKHLNCELDCWLQFRTISGHFHEKLANLDHSLVRFDDVCYDPTRGLNLCISATNWCCQIVWVIRGVALHLLWEQRVGGSNPSTPTNFISQSEVNSNWQQAEFPLSQPFARIQL